MSAISVQFGIVAKKHNSTYIGAHNVSVPCLLKENCSVLTPSLFVDISAATLFGSGTLNHCYIPDFNRFYFVNNWTFERGKWRADCSVDVLASFKNEIGASSQYVLRAASDKDGSVFDSTYPVKNAISESVYDAGIVWDPGSGWYIVGIISGSGSGLGAIGYYGFTASSFAAFCQYLFGSSYVNLSQITQDISEETWKSLYNPFQYIVSCMYVPYDISGMVQAVGAVGVGHWTIPTGAARLITLGPKHIQLSIPWTGSHPRAGRGDYVYCAPYTEVSLTFPPFGHMTLPSDIIYSRGGIFCDCIIDNITGVGTLYIGGSTDPISVVEAKVGINIQLAQMARDYLAMATTAVQGASAVAGSILSGNVAGAISNVATGIDNSVRSQVPKLTTTGSNGGFSSIQSPTTAIFRYYDTVDDDNFRLGSPLCKVRTINTLSGYVMCNRASVDIPGTLDEGTQISTYMNGGFYYE